MHSMCMGSLFDSTGLLCVVVFEKKKKHPCVIYPTSGYTTHASQSQAANVVVILFLFVVADVKHCSN